MILQELRSPQADRRCPLSFSLSFPPLFFAFPRSFASLRDDMLLSFALIVDRRSHFRSHFRSFSLTVCRFVTRRSSAVTLTISTTLTFLATKMRRRGRKGRRERRARGTEEVRRRKRRHRPRRSGLRAVRVGRRRRSRRPDEGRCPMERRARERRLCVDPT